MPAFHSSSLHVWERLKGFIIKDGTILFLACVVMWFLGGFGFTDGGFGMVEDSADSLMAAIGGVIAPIFAPLGFGEWQPVAASISGFTAKEAIVSTMGVLANVAGDTEDAVNVAAGVASWFPTGIAAFSFLMFNLLDSPCLAAIATMAKEMNDRKWFWFAILFQNIFAYVVCLYRTFRINFLIFVRVRSEQQEQHYNKYYESYYSSETECSTSYKGTNLIEAEANNVSKDVLEKNCEPEPFSVVHFFCHSCNSCKARRIKKVEHQEGESCDSCREPA